MHPQVVAWLGCDPLTMIAGLYVEPRLSVEDCDLLMSAGLPTADDAVALLSFSGSADQLMQGQAQMLRLLLGHRSPLLQEPEDIAASLRVSTGLAAFVLEADDTVARSDAQAALLPTAASIILTSPAVARLLATTLTVGNIINNGSAQTAKGAKRVARAFDVSSLKTFATTKAFDGTTTPMKLVRTSLGLTAPEKAEFRAAAMQLHRAARVDIEALEDRLTAFSHSAHKLCQLAARPSKPVNAAPSTQKDDDNALAALRVTDRITVLHRRLVSSMAEARMAERAIADFLAIEIGGAGIPVAVAIASIADAVQQAAV
jgi:hypothetical protein